MFEYLAKENPFLYEKALEEFDVSLGMKAVGLQAARLISDQDIFCKLIAKYIGNDQPLIQEACHFRCCEF